MNVIIGDKKYQSWEEPLLPSKRSKNKTTVIKLYEIFDGDDVPDLIILDKYNYQWILKGCKLIKKEYIKGWNSSPGMDKTNLTITYESRAGSHIKDSIKGEIRDWNINKLLS